jgi:putative endonuclease
MSELKTEALERGVEGEDLAARYLQKQGLRIMDRRYQTRWGEIDLVCRDKETWVFVEVKSRLRPSAIGAVDAITPAKQKKIVGAALSYLKRYSIRQVDVRFDVVTLEAGAVTWIPGAFEPSVDYTY